MKKIWNLNPNVGPTRARDAYVSAYFRVNREYAEKFADRWVILSAKYGFIDPDFIIPRNYNVTFKDPLTNPISVIELKEQIKQKALDTFDTVVVLGGHDYADVVNTAFSDLGVTIKRPVAGLPPDRAKSVVRRAIDEGRPFDC